MRFTFNYKKRPERIKAHRWLDEQSEGDPKGYLEG